MLLGIRVAFFDWEWGRNSAPSEGHKIPCFKTRSSWEPAYLSMVLYPLPNRDAGIVFQFWEGALGPFRLGKLVW